MTSRRSHPPVDPGRSLGVRDLRGLIAGAVRLVWQAARREAITVLLMVLLQGFGVFFLLIQVARLAGGLIDAEGGSGSGVPPSDVVLFVLANSVIILAGVVINNKRMMLAERTSLFTQRKILEVAVLAELDDYDDAGFHDRLQRARISARDRPMMMVEAVLEMVRAAFMLVGIAVALVVLQPWIALFVALAIVPIWLGGVRGGEQYFDFVVETTRQDRIRGYLFSLLTSREAAKEVRAYDLGSHLETSWYDLESRRIRQYGETLRKRFRSAMLASLGSNAVLATVAGVLIVLTQADVLTLGEAATAAGALLVFSQKLMDAVQGTNEFFEAGPLIQDLQDFLELKPRLVADRPTDAIAGAFREIEVDDVTFTYKGATRPAVEGVSLTIRAGEVIALVGENGSGKTTLTKLLGGLYPVDSGRVLVDGTDIALVDPASWRASIAVVFQDYLRYALTARENVRLGATEREPTDEAIRTAAEAAGIDEALGALPDGYDTVLSPQFERGQDLSIGQWQRLALARAFFRSAPLVVLDEPTASLDARAERALFDTVRDLYRDRTVLLISHRFSTVRTADRIVVLSAGQVVEHGTHDELMRASGLYAELFTMQASSYLDPANGASDDEPTDEAIAMS